MFEIQDTQRVVSHGNRSPFWDEFRATVKQLTPGSSQSFVLPLNGSHPHIIARSSSSIAKLAGFKVATSVEKLDGKPVGIRIWRVA